MPYINESYKIGYFPVHKCANTSVKAALLYLETGGQEPFYEASSRLRVAINGQETTVHKYFKDRPNLYPFSDIPYAPDFFKFAILRPPVDRVRSVYADKILKKDTLRLFGLEAEAEARGLPVTPSFVDFVKNIDDYMLISNYINIHLRPLEYYLGTNPMFFDRLYKMSELQLAFDDLSLWVGKRLGQPKLNKSKSLDSIYIDQKSRERIEEKFASDFELFADFF